MPDRAPLVVVQVRVGRRAGTAGWFSIWGRSEATAIIIPNTVEIDRQDAEADQDQQQPQLAHAGLAAGEPSAATAAVASARVGGANGIGPLGAGCPAWVGMSTSSLMRSRCRRIAARETCRRGASAVTAASGTGRRAGPPGARV